MDDKQRQQLMLGLLGLCLGVIGYVLYKSLTTRAMDWGGFTWTLLIGLGVGLVIGAIGYVVGGFMSK